MDQSARITRLNEIQSELNGCEARMDALRMETMRLQAECEHTDGAGGWAFSGDYFPVCTVCCFPPESPR